MPVVDREKLEKILCNALPVALILRVVSTEPHQVNTLRYKKTNP